MNFSSAKARMRCLSSEGWKAKSKPASVLTVVSRPSVSAVLKRALANGKLLDEKLIEGFDAVDLALFDTAKGGVEHFQGPRHSERHQAVLDAVQGGGSGMDHHGRSPATARRSATAW
jgi:hypothetical protein